MKSKKIFLILFSAVFGIAGCLGNKEKASEPIENSNIVVGFSEVGAESDWRVANTESMKEALSEEAGYELLFDDAKQKQENQIKAIRNYILQEVDYIVFAPIVETGWDEVLKEAKEAGIPVIVIDRRIAVEDESLYTTWIGSDFRNEGEMAAHWLETELKKTKKADEKISIVHVMGTEGATAQIGRTESLMKEITNHENWILEETVKGEFTQAKTYEVMNELIKSGLDMDVIYCENDNSAFGAIQAMEENGISYGADGDVIVISFDATEAGLRACMDGKINLDVECNPLHGPRTAAVIQQLQAGERVKKEYFVTESYFTKENLNEEILSNREY